MADDRHAPRPAQQSLPRQAAHVGDVGIVDREAKHPGEKRQRGAGSEHWRVGFWEKKSTYIFPFICTFLHIHFLALFTKRV